LRIHEKPLRKGGGTVDKVKKKFPLYRSTNLKTQITKMEVGTVVGQ